MRKQYNVSDACPFYNRIIKVYHDGVEVESLYLSLPDAADKADELEDNGYEYGYSYEEVVAAFRRYEKIARNRINGDFVCIPMTEVITVIEKDSVRMSELSKADEQGLLMILPCKEGDTIYRIRKFCEENTGYKDNFEPSVEFSDSCEYFDPACCAGDCERCLAVIQGDYDRWYCSHNLDILCNKCKDRMAIQKDIFTLSKIRQIYGTPMFNAAIDPEEIYYLSLNEAEKVLEELKNGR